jgi:hypothetical protein
MARNLGCQAGTETELEAQEKDEKKGCASVPMPQNPPGRDGVSVQQLGFDIGCPRM